MNKKGQVQISFGMIFSIIIVIATIAVGFYVITYFLNLGNCTKVGLFQKSLTDKVDEAWDSVKTQTTFSGNLPSGIQYACFGNLSLEIGADSKSTEILLELQTYGGNGKNAFLYPPKKACELGFYDLKHAHADGFFCVPVKSGVASIKLSKIDTDALVTLSKS